MKITSLKRVAINGSIVEYEIEVADARFGTFTGVLTTDLDGRYAEWDRPAPEAIQVGAWSNGWGEFLTELDEQPQVRQDVTIYYGE